MSKRTTALQDLRAKSADELKELLAQERERLRALRFKVHTQEVKQVHQVRAVREHIARIRTILAATSITSK